MDDEDLWTSSLRNISLITKGWDNVSAKTDVKRAWSPREAAKLVGVSPTTMYEWCRNGTVFARLMGRRWLIPDAALVAFVNGQPYRPEEAVRVAMSDVAHRPNMQSHSRLTRREEEVLAYFDRQMSNAAIAAELGVSTGTVKLHIQNIYKKLGVHTRQAALAARSNDPGGSSPSAEAVPATVPEAIAAITRAVAALSRKDREIALLRALLRVTHGELPLD